MPKKTKENCVMFLAAGQPKHIDKNIAFLSVNNVENLYDWNLKKLGIDKADAFIGLGYDKSLDKYTGYHENVIKITDWQNQGSVGTLLDMIEVTEKNCFIVYGDVIITKQINNMNLDKTTVFYWNQQSDKAKKTDKIILENKTKYQKIGELTFSGLMFISKEDKEFIKENEALIKNVMSDKHIGALISLLKKLGVHVQFEDAADYVHEILRKEDISKVVLTTKANTLSNLRNCLFEWEIPNQVDFTMEEWKDKKTLIFDKIKSLPNQKCIVRSSSQKEDSFTQSNAGAFESKLNISKNIEAIDSAVIDVFRSYGDGASTSEQILIQPMFEKVEASGVAFTTTLAVGGPYYVVSLDEETGLTDIVTSGSKGHLKTYYVLRGTECEDILDPTLRRIISGLKEIEQKLSIETLDIEFCIANDKLVLLQARPLIAKNNKYRLTPEKYKSLKDTAIDKYKSEFFEPNKGSIFGKMPDWNPAEIIGDNPKPLALSLYDILITANTWAEQRYHYGNRDLRGKPLVTSFLGKPFVNVKLSIESFLPRGLSEELSSSLTEFYLKKFQKFPKYHDKLEFKVVPTSYNFSTENMMDELRSAGFLSKDVTNYKKELIGTTVKSITSFFDLKDEFLLNEEILKDSRWAKVNNSEKFYEAINNCITFGTLPFAHFARFGFVAVSFLKSGVEKKIITEVEYDQLLRSINSVTSEIDKDINELRLEQNHEHQVKLRVKFEKKYGHLRPGTYDITIKRYDEAFDNYFDFTAPKNLKQTDKRNIGSRDQILEKIYNRLPDEFGSFTKKQFIDFITGAIEFREYSKFCFTKLVSNLLDSIKSNIKDFGVEELCFLDVNEAAYYLNSENNEHKQKYFKKIISDRKDMYAITCQFELPNIISSARDFEYFELPPTDPNYIGKSNAEGEIVYLSSDEISKNIKNKIVLIHSADPGYDWIFAHEIKGLITEFGGANSHMAIRCSELGIPAAIGVGAEKLSELKKLDVIKIDCCNRRLGDR